MNTFLPTSSWSAKPGMVPSIDGIRGTSILMVLAGHLLLPSSLIGISGLGLLVFFFISGFLITRLLLNESKSTGAVSLSGFYTRRILRLYPVIIIFGCIIIITAEIRGQEFRSVDVIAVFLYFVNYLVIYYDHLHLHYSLPMAMMWSLSIEEHFYLFAPLIFIGLGHSARKFAIWAIGVCASSLLLRLLYAYWSPNIVHSLELYWRSETRFDSIAYGVLLACLTELKTGRDIIRLMIDRRIFIAAIGLLSLTFAFRGDYYQNTWRFTFQGLLLIPIVSGVVFGEPIPFLNRFLNARMMRIIGALSYSLYVWHSGVAFLFEPWLRQMNLMVGHWLQFFVAFIFAAASYKLVERPIVDLRKKLRDRSLQGSAPIPPTI